jgi:hypothetical protein
MRECQIQAMSRLAAANPLHNIDAMSQWTQADEDVLLAFLLADADGSFEEVPSSHHKSRRLASVRRLPRLKRPALLVVAAVVVGAVALQAVDLGGSGAPRAFAAWTATTTTPPASQLASADASCGRSYSLMVKAGLPDVAGSLPPLTLTDSRGPFELLLYSDPSWFFACFWGHGSASLDGGGGPEAPASPNSIGVPQVPFDRNANGSGYTMAYGYVGAQVRAVTLDLTNGTSVEATVQNGLYAAWWPVRTDVASAAVTTSAGVFHQDLGDDGPNNAGPAH